MRRREIPNILALRAFECAARHQSFTRAAQELNLTQSTVSRQIKELEEQLQVNLFERVRQRVVLSRAGQQLLIDTRRILRDTEEAVLRTRAAAWSEWTLNIAVLPTFASRWMIPRLPGFLQQHPLATVNMASRAEPFDFREESFDMAIHYGQPIWAGASCTHLCQEEILPVASQSFIRQSPVQSKYDLAQRPLLHLSTRPHAWEDWFAERQVDHRVEISHRFDQFSMLIEAVVAGLGAALIPRYFIQEELRQGTLCILFDDSLSTDNSYYIVVPDDQRENQAVATFKQWLQQQVK